MHYQSQILSTWVILILTTGFSFLHESGCFTNFAFFWITKSNVHLSKTSEWCARNLVPLQLLLVANIYQKLFLSRKWYISHVPDFFPNTCLHHVHLPKAPFCSLYFNSILVLFCATAQVESFHLPYLIAREFFSLLSEWYITVPTLICFTISFICSTRLVYYSIFLVVVHQTVLYDFLLC